MPMLRYEKISIKRKLRWIRQQQLAQKLDEIKAQDEHRMASGDLKSSDLFIIDHKRMKGATVKFYGCSAQKRVLPY